MIHSIMMDKRFTIMIGYFLASTISKQRVFNSNGNAATTISFVIPISPPTRGKNGVNLD